MGDEKEDAQGIEGCHVSEEDILSPTSHTIQEAQHGQSQEGMADQEEAKNIFMCFQIIIFKTKH